MWAHTHTIQFIFVDLEIQAFKKIIADTTILNFQRFFASILDFHKQVL